MRPQFDPARTCRRSEFHLVLLVAVGNCNPGDGSRVTAQEEERDIAGGGHQVDQHGHADGTQSREVQLLNQEATQEDTQTGTGDGCHTWRRKRNNPIRSNRNSKTDKQKINVNT